MTFQMQEDELSNTADEATVVDQEDMNDDNDDNVITPTVEAEGEHHEENHEEKEASPPPPEDEDVALSTVLSSAVSATIISATDNDSTGNNVDSLRDEEDKVVGAEILFLRDPPRSYHGWDTLRWMSYSGARKVKSLHNVYRRWENETKPNGISMFWKTGREQRYEERALIIYEEPSLFLLVRRPANLQEIDDLVGLDEDVDEDPESLLRSYWVVGGAAEPASCKLRLSSLTTPTCLSPADADDRERSCFQIITPTVTIPLSAVQHTRADSKKKEQSFKDSGAFLETVSVEQSIAKSIYAAHSQDGDPAGQVNRGIVWKHQVVIGSLHSLVVAGSTKHLENAIAYARNFSGGPGSDVSSPEHLPSRIVNAKDDSGFSALYYACALKRDVAVGLLVKTGADVNFQSEVDGTTLLHICAQNLDSQSLSTLLSVTQPNRLDPNVVDKDGRTPMYVAAVKGSYLDGGKNPAALGRCIAALKARGGKMQVSGAFHDLLSPINALATTWLHAYLEVVFDHVPFRYPFQRSGSFDGLSATTMSLGALYEYPIHSALLRLRKLPRNGSKNASTKGALIETLRILIEHGFEINERIDPAFTISRNEWAQELSKFAGYSPLQVIGHIALEMEAAKKGMDAMSLLDCSKLIQDAAEILAQSGGRLSLDPPMPARPRRESADGKQPVSNQTQRKIELLPQKLDADTRVMSLLGGRERLNAAGKLWTGRSKVETRITRLMDENESNIEDSTAAGGSDSMSCAVCWAIFGTILNRKHRCRVTRRFICDACSSKRLVRDRSEFRLSDGQYHLATRDAEKEKRSSSAPTVTAPEGNHSSDRARASLRLDRLEAEEQAQRESLFGGMVAAATNFVMGEEDSSSSQVNGLTNSLDQTRDALNQRGEKLAALSDKSAQLVDASADFAQMAKALNKESQKGLFW